MEERVVKGPDRTSLDIAADLAYALSHRFGDDLSDFGGLENRQWAIYAEEFLRSPDGQKAEEKEEMGEDVESDQRILVVETGK